MNDSYFGPTNRGAVPSGRSTSATVAYVEYKHSRRPYCRPTIPQLLCCINFRFTTIAYIIMTMRVFIRNIAGGDSSR